MLIETSIVQYPEIMLTGVSTRTTNAREAGPDGQLPKLWDAYFRSGMPAEEGLIEPHWIYALYTDYESDVNGAYTVVIGHATDREGASADSERARAVIPGGKYRVFTTDRGPVHEVVPQAWGAIWAYFRDSEEKRTYTGDFERYDARTFDPANAQVQIYLAIE